MEQALVSGEDETKMVWNLKTSVDSRELRRRGQTIVVWSCENPRAFRLSYH
jgi:hypothetical protein